MTELPAEFLLPSDVFERQRSVLSVEVAGSVHGSRRRIAIALAFVILALLGAVIATPARGVGSRILDLIQGPPAPPEVQASFATSNAHRAKLFAFADEAGETLRDRFSPVVPGKTRGIFAIESVDGPIYLWAAPTEDGRQCWLIQAGAEVVTGRPYGVMSCDIADDAAALRPSYGWTAERPNIKILSARVYDASISEVVVELDGAAPVPLPMVAGYALGMVPKEQRVVAFVGRDVEGDEIARVTLHEPREEPSAPTSPAPKSTDD